MNKTDRIVGELAATSSLGEIPRHHVWRGPRVRDLLDLLYRGYTRAAGIGGVA